MDDIMKIMRTQNLEDKTKRFYRLMNKMNQELREYQDSCDHEVIVFTEFSHSFGGYDDYLFRKCLFCGKEADYARAFYSSEYSIDVSYNQESVQFLCKEEKFKLVRQLYVKFSLENPHLSKKELVDMIEKEIANPSPMFYEIKNSIHPYKVK